MTWQELMKSENARNAMRDLGNCAPTDKRTDKEVKGRYVDDFGESDSFYMKSDELRQMARGLHEVADWLDAMHER